MYQGTILPDTLISNEEEMEWNTRLNSGEYESCVNRLSEIVDDFEQLKDDLVVATRNIDWIRKSRSTIGSLLRDSKDLYDDIDIAIDNCNGITRSHNRMLKQFPGDAGEKYCKINFIKDLEIESPDTKYDSLHNQVIKMIDKLSAIK